MRSALACRGFRRLARVMPGALLLLAGCVTQSQYDQVVAERDAFQDRSLALTYVVRGLGFELALRDAEVAVLQREQEELADEVLRWAAQGAVQMQLLKDGLHLILPHDVLFDSGSAQLHREGQKLLVELVEEIKNQPYQVAVLGFTDNVSVGPLLAKRYPSNWELAAARASSVVRLMEREGIPTDQLVAISRGESQPIASNDTASGRAQNRRIDIRIRPVVN